MSPQLSPALPEAIHRLIQGPEPLGLPLLSVEEGRPPHSAMISAYEIVIVHGLLHFMVYQGSRTASALAQNGLATILFVMPQAVYYLKGRAQLALEFPPVSVFAFRLIEVLEDTPTADERATRLVSGIRFDSSPADFRRRLELRQRVFETLQTTAAPPLSGA